MATSSWQITFVYHDTNIHFLLPFPCTRATEIRTDRQTDCHYLLFQMLVSYCGHAQNTMSLVTRKPVFGALDAQANLRHCGLHMAKTGFLMTWLLWYWVPAGNRGAKSLHIPALFFTILILSIQTYRSGQIV